MKNYDDDFYGRQEGERILYVVKPHFLATIFQMVKIWGVALIIFLAFLMIGSQLGSISGIFSFGGIILSLTIIFFGTKILADYHKRNISYITDRRVVHFEPTTLFATNSRTLSWDEVVKVKSFPPNFFWKQLAVGSVVVTARTPGRPDSSDHDIMVDDIELKDVYYYRDLGNYIDKILFTFKQRPKEVDLIRPFVPKPKGFRD